MSDGISVWNIVSFFIVYVYLLLIKVIFVKK